MDFSWNEAKSEHNFLTRGFGVDFAALIFAGPILQALDDRRDYGEVRIRAIGKAQGFVLAVVYTDRGDARRIISARLANKRERALWLSL